MKRIFQLITEVDITDEGKSTSKISMKVFDRLVYLDRLVTLYCKFLKDFRKAEVKTDGNNITIKFIKTNGYGYSIWTKREFPMDAIEGRITSYKQKIKKEFAIRHENPRLQREHQIYKWKKYIEYVKIHMSE